MLTLNEQLLDCLITMNAKAKQRANIKQTTRRGVASKKIFTTELRKRTLALLRLCSTKDAQDIEIVDSEDEEIENEPEIQIIEKTNCPKCRRGKNICNKRGEKGHLSLKATSLHPQQEKKVVEKEKKVVVTQHNDGATEDKNENEKKEDEKKEDEKKGKNAQNDAFKEFDVRVKEYEEGNQWEDVCLDGSKGKDCTICNARKEHNRLINQLEFQKKKVNYSGQLKLQKFSKLQTR